MKPAVMADGATPLESIESEALGNKPLYQRLQLLDYLGVSIWQFSLALFLVDGLHCNLFQVGVILAGSFILQVVFEIPSGVFGDVFGHHRSVFFSAVLYVLYPVGYIVLFVVSQRAPSGEALELVVLWGVVIEALFALATALQSGSIETWASEPIRRVARRERRRGRNDRTLVDRWYGALETGAKMRMSVGLLVGGVAGYAALALGVEMEPRSFWLFPWAMALAVYLWFAWESRRVLVRGEPLFGRHLRQFQWRFRHGLARIAKICIEFCVGSRRHDTHSSGAAFISFVGLNSLWYFSILAISIFWAPVTWALLVRGDRPVSTWAAFALMGLIWGIISLSMTGGSVLLSRLDTDRLARWCGAERFRRTYLTVFVLYGALFAGMYELSSSNLGRAGVALTIVGLAACKFLEGVGRPLMSTQMAWVCPANGTRATLLSFESWVRTVVTGLLFIFLGAAGQKSVSLVWLFAALMMMVAAAATLLVPDAGKRQARPAAAHREESGPAWELRPLAVVVLFVAGISAMAWWRLDSDYVVHYGIDHLAAEASERAPQGYESRQAAPDGEGAVLMLDGPRGSEELVRLSSDAPWGRMEWRQAFGGEDRSAGGLLWSEWWWREDRLTGEYRRLSALPAVVELWDAPERAESVTVSVDGEQMPREWLSLQDWLIVLALVLSVVGLGFVLLTLFLSSVKRAQRAADVYRRFEKKLAQRPEPTPEARYRIGDLFHSAIYREDGSSRILDIFDDADVASYWIGMAGDGESPELRFERVDGASRTDSPLPLNGASLSIDRSLLVPARADGDSGSVEEGVIEIPVEDVESLFEAGTQAGGSVLAVPLLPTADAAGKRRRAAIDGLLVVSQRSGFGTTHTELRLLRQLGDSLGELLEDVKQLEFMLSHGELDRPAARRSDVEEEFRRLLGKRDWNPGDAFWGTRSGEYLFAIAQLHRVEKGQERAVRYGRTEPADFVDPLVMEDFLRLCSHCAIAAVIGPLRRPTGADRDLVEIDRGCVEINWLRERYSVLYLWQVYENLLRNALFHARDGDAARLAAEAGSRQSAEPIATVKLWQEDGEAVLEFRDVGDGIPLTAWEESLARHRLADRSRGLWLAWHGARRLGGRLEATKGSSAGHVFPRLVIPVAG